MEGAPFKNSILHIYALFAAVILSSLCLAFGQLRVGFYSESCPEAESIVRSVVGEATRADPTVAPALLRLHHHDCFVRGCEASILIEGQNAEKKSNKHAGVRGFRVIERAKTILESACPRAVSCADILALAARDAIVLTNGPNYDVPTGRRDGLVSNARDADDLPEVGDSLDQLKTKFILKGLSEKDLVVLSVLTKKEVDTNMLVSGAHTIGTTACFFLERRLYNFSGGGDSDPSINPDFLPQLQSRCPNHGDINVRLALDQGSEFSFDDSILNNIRNGFAVIESDAKLYNDESTMPIVDSYFGLLSGIFGPSFESDFAESMVKMGQIGVLTGSRGKIRRVCSELN